MVTATLSSGTGPLQGTTTATVSGGMATFANLADNTAETISLKFSSGGLTSAIVEQLIVVSPAAASSTGHPHAAVIDGDGRAGIRSHSRSSTKRTSTATWKRATTARS